MSRFRAWTGVFSGGSSVFPAIFAVLASLTVSGVVFLIMGNSPWQAYSAIIYGAFGNMNNIAETLSRTSTFLFLALAATVAFKAYIFNIGMEGQLYIGALFATFIAISLGNLTPAVILPVTLLAGFIGGGLWALIAGALKAFIKSDEIITTLMMNYVAIYFINYMVSGPMQQQGGFHPRSDLIPSSAEFPVFFSQRGLHLGIVLAVLAAIVLHYIFQKTVFGYEIKIAGHNRDAARFGGIDFKRITLKVMFISGGLAGLAGANLVCGTYFRLYDTISHGFGYTAIAIALVGGLAPLGNIVAAFLFGVLDIGSGAMQYRAGIPASMVLFLQGLIILFYIMNPVFSSSNFRMWMGRARLLRPGKHSTKGGTA